MLDQKVHAYFSVPKALFLYGAAIIGLGITMGSCAEGSETIPSSDGGGSQSTSSTTSGAGGANQGGAGGANQGGAGGANQGGAGTGGSGGSVGMPSAVLASLEVNSLYINCMPPGPASVVGSFDAKYNNSMGVNTALPKVTSAKLSMTYLGNTYTWTFSVMPSSSIVGAGLTSTVTHNAGAGSGTGTGKLCDYCQGVWTLSVDWDLGGKTGSDMLGPQPAQCVF